MFWNVFLQKMVVPGLQSELSSFFGVQISALIHVKSWHLVGDKPLADPMMILYTGAYKRFPTSIFDHFPPFVNLLTLICLERLYTQQITGYIVCAFGNAKLLMFFPCTAEHVGTIAMHLWKPFDGKQYSRLLVELCSHNVSSMSIFIWLSKRLCVM